MVILLAIPMFLLFLAIESISYKYLPADDELGYELRDTATSLSMGIGSRIWGLLWDVVALLGLSAAFVLTPLRVDMGHWYSWVALFVLEDLCYYCFHRGSHRIRLFWVGVPCDPDLNQDGNVDQDDVAYLINVVGGGNNSSGIDPDFRAMIHVLPTQATARYLRIDLSDASASYLEAARLFADRGFDVWVVGGPGEKAMARIHLSPLRCSSLCGLVGQIFTCLSHPAVASIWLSGENVSVDTSRVWPRKEANSLPLDKSQSLATPSSPVVASIFPLGAKARLQMVP